MYMYIFAITYYCKGIISPIDDGMNAIAVTLVLPWLEWYSSSICPLLDYLNFSVMQTSKNILCRFVALVTI